MRAYALAVLLALMLLPGCCDHWVASSRARYDAIAPEYKAYVEADPSMEDRDKAIRLRTLETWLLQLQAEEEDD